jgi:uncharacterized membrane protein YkoI
MRKFIKFCINSFVLFIFSTHYILADTDYNQAKKLLDAGEILSLEKILAKISTQYPGHILEVELEIEDNISLYEIELVDSKGQVWEFKINARTGEIIERKQDD